MHHVIIGAGPAGVNAAESLRKLDPEARLTLIGDEPEPPYSRMAIPYYLSNKINESGTYLRKTADHFAHLRIDLIQDKVTQIDAGAKTLTLEKGHPIGYDRLLIATGARPIVPPIPGVDSAGVHACWTLEDARQIVNLAQPGAKVVLMGAGFIGCIILEALAARRVQLTVVEMENRMVPRMMNETSGGLIKSWCESKGVRVLTSTRVTSIEPAGGDHRLGVSLDSGSTLEADLVISATGVQPNVGFLEGCSVKVEQGILVNEYMQTSEPQVYAAGDVAQGKDFSTGGFHVQAIQPTAVEHGRLCANNMAKGHEVIHWGNVNMNVLDTMGLISSSFGLWMGVDGGDSGELSNPSRYRYLNLQFADDVLVGASTLGLTEHVGVLRGLIQGRTHLGLWKRKLMQDPTQVMEAYLASTQGVGVNASVL
jgi:NAD(P)H-nitrite reductase large subunit